MCIWLVAKRKWCRICEYKHADAKEFCFGLFWKGIYPGQKVNAIVLGSINKNYFLANVERVTFEEKHCNGKNKQKNKPKKPDNQNQPKPNQAQNHPSSVSQCQYIILIGVLKLKILIPSSWASLVVWGVLFGLGNLVCYLFWFLAWDSFETVHLASGIFRGITLDKFAAGFFLGEWPFMLKAEILAITGVASFSCLAKIQALLTWLCTSWHSV